MRSFLAILVALAATGPAGCQPSVMLISNETGNSISTLNLTTFAVGTYHTGLLNPDGIGFGPDGALYATSFTQGTFNRITSASTYQTIAAGMNGSAGFARDQAGAVYVANFGNPSGGGTTVSRIAPNGSINVAFANGFSTPDDVKYDFLGTSLYVTDWDTNRIYQMDPTNGSLTIHVDAAAGLSRPSSMTFDSANNMYVTNWNTGAVSRVTPAGVVTNNFATGVPNSFGLLLDEAGGFFYATSWTNGTVSRFPLLGGAATVIATGFSGPTFMAFVPVPEPAGLLALSIVVAVGFIRLTLVRRRAFC